jgi:hypothetical protein
MKNSYLKSNRNYRQENTYATKFIDIFDIKKLITLDMKTLEKELEIDHQNFLINTIIKIKKEKWYTTDLKEFIKELINIRNYYIEFRNNSTKQFMESPEKLNQQIITNLIKQTPIKIHLEICFKKKS